MEQGNQLASARDLADRRAAAVPIASTVPAAGPGQRVLHLQCSMRGSRRGLGPPRITIPEVHDETGKRW
jgi:hypothetical protein